MTSSRQSARPIATRSEIWRTFVDPRPRGEDRRRQVRLEPAGDRPGRRRRSDATGAGPGLDGHRGAASAWWMGIAPSIAAIGDFRARSHRPVRVSVETADTLRAMTRSAFVFPGQGSQSVGMGRDARRRVARRRRRSSPRPTPRSASRSAGSRSAARPSDLDRTENAQPALLATSIAYLAALRERSAAAGDPLDPPAFAAGHSMGQYSALVAAEVISLDDGVRLVRERGRLMQASGAGPRRRDGRDHRARRRPAAGARRRGPARTAIFGVANRNAPGQVVVSGERAAIEAAADDRARSSAPGRSSSCPSRSRPTRR